RVPLAPGAAREYGPAGKAMGIPSIVGKRRPTRKRRPHLIMWDSGSGEQAQRVDRLAVQQNFVVQVRTRGPARRTDVADQVAASNLLPRLHGKAREVAVARRDPGAVLDHDGVAVIAVVGAAADDAVGCRTDGRAAVGGNVEAGVEVLAAVDRIAARAETRGEPAGDRPECRRGAGQGLLAFDSGPDRRDAA